MASRKSVSKMLGPVLFVVFTAVVAIITSQAKAEDLRFMHRPQSSVVRPREASKTVMIPRVDVHAVKLRLGRGIVTPEGVAAALSDKYQTPVSWVAVYKTGGDEVENLVSSGVEFMTVRFQTVGSPVEYHCQLMYRPNESQSVAFLMNRCFNIETREVIPAVYLSRQAVLGAQ